jgi:hypothetical protein
MVQGPREIATEEMDGAGAIDDEGVVLQDLLEEAKDLLVIGVEAFGSHIEDEVSVMERPSEPSDEIIPLDEGGSVAFLEDRVGKREAGNARSHHQKILLLTHIRRRERLL